MATGRTDMSSKRRERAYVKTAAVARAYHKPCVAAFSWGERRDRRELLRREHGLPMAIPGYRGAVRPAPAGTDRRRTRTGWDPAVSIDRQWWRDAVIYQVYVKSFADIDGDGIGDLDGVTAHLDHLTRLGVDGLWLNPCYPSPGHDGGYDVADYLNIDALYGGTAGLDRLIAAAHERGLRVLMDVVPNHCSVDHP